MTSSRRTVPEWIGRTPDTAIPPRICQRVADAAGGCARCGAVFCAQVQPQIDHIIALINGGENRERNLQALCTPCHQLKTADDVALKAKVARKRAKHFGTHPRTSRPVGGWNRKQFIQTVDGRVLHAATREPVTRR